MKKLWFRLKMALFVLLPMCGYSHTRSAIELLEEDFIDISTVPTLDVSRYMGVWYEIARYENRFERGMTHVRATYSLDMNGKLRIQNEGVKNGKHYTSNGKGKIPDSLNYPGRLRVSFFLWFYSDYYVLELDERDYMYAVVGSSDSDFLWILYRHPVMPKELLTDLLQRIEKRGYDVSRLLFVDQK